MKIRSGPDKEFSVCLRIPAVCTMRKVDLCCDKNDHPKGHGYGVYSFRQRESTPVHLFVHVNFFARFLFH